jgi:hypothetical protein
VDGWETTNRTGGAELGGTAHEIVTVNPGAVSGPPAVVAPTARRDARERRRIREPVAHRVKAVAYRSVFAAGRAGDGLAREPVDAVVVPGDRTAARLRYAGQVAHRAALIAVGRRRAGQRRQPVQRVIGKSRLHAVGISDRGHIAGRVVGVGGRIRAREPVIHHRDQPVQIVVGVAHRRAIRIRRRDRLHMPRRIERVVQRALGCRFGRQPVHAVVSVRRRPGALPGPQRRGTGATRRLGPHSRNRIQSRESQGQLPLQRNLMGLRSRQEDTVPTVIRKRT